MTTALTVVGNVDMVCVIKCGDAREVNYVQPSDLYSLALTGNSAARVRLIEMCRARLPGDKDRSESLADRSVRSFLRRIAQNFDDAAARRLKAEAIAEANLALVRGVNYILQVGWRPKDSSHLTAYLRRTISTHFLKWQKQDNLITVSATSFDRELKRNPEFKLPKCRSLYKKHNKLRYNSADRPRDRGAAEALREVDREIQDRLLYRRPYVCFDTPTRSATCKIA
jgi:hypothetical protein